MRHVEAPGMRKDDPVAAVRHDGTFSTMRLAPQLGQNPRFLQLNATKSSCLQL
jgi:hypothetical protein